MPLIQTALAWDRKHEGERSPSVARDYEAAGLATQFAGDIAASRKNYADHWLSALSVQGRLHPKVDEDLNNLGTAAYLQGNQRTLSSTGANLLLLSSKFSVPITRM